MIRSITKNKLFSFARQFEVHQYDNSVNVKPSIMMTYNSGADGHYVSKMD